MNRLPTPCFSHPAPATARSAWRRAVYLAIVLLALASASITTMAQGLAATATDNDTDLARYRCAVLGETRSCHQAAPRPDVWYEERVELGPYAQYLRYLGTNTEEAIAQARRRGEEPQRHVVQVTRIPLSAQQAHDRGTGQRSVPDTERKTLSITPALERAPQLHDDWSAWLPAAPTK